MLFVAVGSSRQVLLVSPFVVGNLSAHLPHAVYEREETLVVYIRLRRPRMSSKRSFALQAKVQP